MLRALTSWTECQGLTDLGAVAQEKAAIWQDGEVWHLHTRGHKSANFQRINLHFQRVVVEACATLGMMQNQHSGPSSCVRLSTLSRPAMHCLPRMSMVTVHNHALPVARPQERTIRGKLVFSVTRE